VDKGGIRADGKPDEVMTGETLSDMFGIDVRRMRVEEDGHVYSICIPVNHTQDTIRAAKEYKEELLT
jgi:ABC-type cobalamin/Fe3+-siderophores transport system ATPase subunit